MDGEWYEDESVLDGLDCSSLNARQRANLAWQINYRSDFAEQYSSAYDLLNVKFGIGISGYADLTFAESLRFRAILRRTIIDSIEQIKFIILHGGYRDSKFEPYVEAVSRWVIDDYGCDWNNLMPLERIESFVEGFQYIRARSHMPML